MNNACHPDVCYLVELEIVCRLLPRRITHQPLFSSRNSSYCRTVVLTEIAPCVLNVKNRAVAIFGPTHGSPPSGLRTQSRSPIISETWISGKSVNADRNEGCEQTSLQSGIRLRRFQHQCCANQGHQRLSQSSEQGRRLREPRHRSSAAIEMPRWVSVRRNQQQPGLQLICTGFVHRSWRDSKV